MLEDLDLFREVVAQNVFEDESWWTTIYAKVAEV